MVASKSTGFVEIIREVTTKRSREAITDLIESVFSWSWSLITARVGRNVRKTLATARIVNSFGLFSKGEPRSGIKISGQMPFFNSWAQYFYLSGPIFQF